MAKIIFGFLIFFSAISWGNTTPLNFGDLRLRLLLHAEEDVSKVDSMPETKFLGQESKIDLELTKHEGHIIKKNHFYRVAYLSTFDTDGGPNSPPNTVYNVTLEELDKDLQATGVSLQLGAKATTSLTVANFTQIPGTLSQNPTLTTGRAGVGDHVINALPVILNKEELQAYHTFEVVAISKEYIPFTLAHKYTLKLREVRTGKIYELAAPGLTQLPIWAHLVAPKNRRVIKLWHAELHY